MTNTTNPTQLIEELYRDYLRTTASPLPQHPATLGWQMNTAQALSGLVMALFHLDKANPSMAQELVDWWTRKGDENTGPQEGPNPAEFEAWAKGQIARNPQRFEQWVTEAREAAETAARSLTTTTA
ncbi:hypothetical protein [Streptomyces olivaceiscleroticus]|uniref:Uncharacterized protein n=1 Tax=Streptomyces olivaceiscleroticus TaxID=68245 RepID=A0ABP3LJ44_9ACTN